MNPFVVSIGLLVLFVIFFVVRCKIFYDFKRCVENSNVLSASTQNLNDQKPVKLPESRDTFKDCEIKTPKLKKGKGLRVPNLDRSLKS